MDDAYHGQFIPKTSVRHHKSGYIVSPTRFGRSSSGGTSPHGHPLEARYRTPVEMTGLPATAIRQLPTATVVRTRRGETSSLVIVVCCRCERHYGSRTRHLDWPAGISDRANDKSCTHRCHQTDEEQGPIRLACQRSRARCSSQR